MAGQIAQSIAAAVWQLVDRQHGAVARRQLLELGLRGSAIDHRIACGRLHRVYRGVYAVGRPQLTLAGRWMAAVLACGPAARLSHISAAVLWGMLEPRAGLIHVTVPSPLQRRHPGLLIHRRALAESDRAERSGIPVIAVVPTLIDLATQLDRDGLEAAVSAADKLDLVDPETLRTALDDFPRRPGVGILRTTLDRRTFRATDSWLERRFLPIARRAGLSPPETRRYQNEFRVDFFWPELGLVVETDGLRYHRTPAQQARDRVRDQQHMAAGLVPLRFTHEQIRFEPAYVEATLRAVVARLSAND